MENRDSFFLQQRPRAAGALQQCPVEKAWNEHVKPFGWASSHSSTLTHTRAQLYTLRLSRELYGGLNKIATSNLLPHTLPNARRWPDKRATPPQNQPKKKIGKNPKKIHEISLNFWNWSGAKSCRSCNYRKLLKNVYLCAKISFDAEENEPSKIWWFGWKIKVKFGIESFN